MPDFSIDVSHEVSREAVREQLPHLRPPLRLLAEELLAEESTIDFVTVDPAGHVALLLLGEEGEDASLLTRGLAHRAWVKARLEIAQKWQSDYSRPYFSCAKGSGAVDTVWRQAALAEPRSQEGIHTATVLWDLKSFFDHVDHGLLRMNADRYGYPRILLEMALGA